MPRYKVYGADRDTGVDQSITITADTDQDAEAIAGGRGLLVSRVVEVEEAQPPQVVEHAPPAFHPAQQAHRGHDASAPTINVNTPNRSNGAAMGMGIAALIMGVLALIVSWIPLVGCIALPFAGLGVLLGGIGVIMALVTRGHGIGMPIAGTACSAIAIVVFIAVTGMTSVALDSVARSAQTRPNPDVGELAVLELGDERVVRIQGRLLRDQRQAYYYQVEQAGEVVREPVFFGSLPPGSPLLSFVWHESDDGRLVGFATQGRPSEILFLHDFASGASWPAHEGNESVEQIQVRGRSMLEPLSADHPDKRLTLLRAEGYRPLLSLD